MTNISPQMGKDAHNGASMKPPSAVKGPLQDDLEVLEGLLREGAGTEDTAQRFHAAASASGQLDRARRLFDLLRSRQPDNYQIAGLYIATCLQQGDDPAAMAAIETLTGRADPPEGLLDAGLAVRSRLGHMQPDAASVSLSLCMIARNEARMLGPCLGGIKPLVDEIILVDTGSDDRTGDIGRLFGAQVHSFAWCDDFAAARNFALLKASGDWILVLDADEAIAPADFGAIRSLLHAGQSGPAAFTIETRNYCHTANSLGWQANDGRYPHHQAGLGWFPSHKVRLFKRRPEIRFHFPVHERVEPSLRNLGPIAACTVPVHHYGHLNESRNLEKARKYYALGYAKLEAMAQDAAAIRELAVQAGQLERWQEAIHLWERLLGIRPEFAEAMVNLASANWQLGRYAQSLEWARRAVAEDDTLKEAQFNLALSHLLMGDYHQSARLLEKLVNRQPDYLAADFMLSIAKACQGHIDLAAAGMRRLGQGPAGSALPAAIGDIHRRLVSAGHAQAGCHLKDAFREYMNQ